MSSQNTKKRQGSPDTIIVGSTDARINQTLVRKTGCGDGDDRSGQRLARLTAAQSLVTLKIYKHRNSACHGRTETGFIYL